MYKTFIFSKTHKIYIPKISYKEKLIIIINLIIILFIFYKLNLLYDLLILNNRKKNNFNINYILKYQNKFIVIKHRCKTCGLFTFFNTFLDCINTFINKGYIPIIDLLSYPNIFNGFNVSSLNKNPWEFFFEQPFGFSLESVKKNAHYITYFDYNYTICNLYGRKNIFYNKATLDYWHTIALKYIPIKKEIIKESNYIRKKLFKNCKNILGILLRGTDYISLKPKNHPIQPNTEIVIKDVIKQLKKNKYDYIFLTTEDQIILKKFIIRFGSKLKYLKNKNINYNYTQKTLLAYNKNILGNFDFQKIYLINIIILSSCIDIISSIAGGASGAFVLSKGYRYVKLYYLGKN